MFNKILSSIGIGSAKVDTKLANSKVRVGEELVGEVHIQGGNVEQSINQIYMNLFTEYEKEVNDSKSRYKEVLVSHRLANQLVIKPGEKIVIPFQFVIPYHTPLSVGTQKVYVSTGLDIEMAIDPSDLDPVTVLPGPIVSALFEELEEMGFRQTHRSGICEYKKQFRHVAPFVQEFEFKPSGLFRGELDEIELMFRADEEHVQVYMQVDKKARGLMGMFEEALDLDEQYVRFTIVRRHGVSKGELQNRIRQALDRRR